jgi:hypothetical protein
MDPGGIEGVSQGQGWHEGGEAARLALSGQADPPRGRAQDGKGTGHQDDSPPSRGATGRGVRQPLPTPRPARRGRPSAGGGVPALIRPPRSYLYSSAASVQPRGGGHPTRDLQFAAVAWNTRDHLLNPIQGFLLYGRVDPANTALLFEVSFVRGGLTSGARREEVCQPVRRWVVLPYSERDAAPLDRTLARRRPRQRARLGAEPAEAGRCPR